MCVSDSESAIRTPEPQPTLKTFNATLLCTLPVDVEVFDRSLQEVQDSDVDSKRYPLFLSQNIL